MTTAGSSVLPFDTESIEGMYDVQRVEGLLHTVVCAFHDNNEARSHTNSQQLPMEELDYDLPEMPVYEKAFELKRSLQTGDWDK